MIEKPIQPDFTPEKTYKIPSFNNKIATIGIIIGVLITFSSIFIYSISYKDALGIYTAIIATIALIYHAKHLENNFKMNDYKVDSDGYFQNRKYDLDKKVIAVNLITEWYKDFTNQAITIKKLRNEYYSDGGNNDLKLIIEGVLDLKGTKYDYRKELIPILNYFEKISIAVLTDTADEIVLQEYFGDIFHSYFEVFEPFIKSRRKGNGSLKNAFDNFEKLAKKWTPSTKA